MDHVGLEPVVEENAADHLVLEWNGELRGDLAVEPRLHAESAIAATASAARNHAMRKRAKATLAKSGFAGTAAIRRSVLCLRPIVARTRGASFSFTSHVSQHLHCGATTAYCDVA